jgi:hypothetical protein
MDRHGWQRQILEADLKTPLPKRLKWPSVMFMPSMRRMWDSQL